MAAVNWYLTEEERKPSCVCRYLKKKRQFEYAYPDPRHWSCDDTELTSKYKVVHEQYLRVQYHNNEFEEKFRSIFTVYGINRSGILNNIHEFW
jgi:hypothetical protein